MKVLQLISSMHIGGAERVVQHLTRHLDTRRFEVEVCCTQASGVLGEELRQDGYRVIDLKTTGRKLDSYRIPLRINSLISERQYDIVHTHSTGALLDAAPLRLFRRRPVLIHTFHFGNFPHVKRRRYLYATRLAQPLATTLVAVSETQRRSVIEHLRVREDRVATIYNGVEENPITHDRAVAEEVRREFGVPEGTRIVGCIATMIEQKGIPFLLETARIVAAEQPNVRFLVVGGGRLLNEMKGRASDMGLLDSTVNFGGWRSDAPRLLSAFDVLVSPSLWEGFAMVLLEGMAARKPIVATLVGENDRAIEHMKSGLLVSPRDPAALASAIGKVLGDAVLARGLADRAYERFTERFTAQRMSDQYAEIYERLVRPEWAYTPSEASVT